jgi:membrane protease YdiL (CAAX protease family)
MSDEEEAEQEEQDAAEEEADEPDVEFRASGIVHLPDHLSNSSTPMAAARTIPLPPPPLSIPRLQMPVLPIGRGSIRTHPIAFVAAFLAIVELASLAIHLALLPAARILRGHPHISLDIDVFVEAICAVAALIVMARLVEHRSLGVIGFDLHGSPRQFGIGLAIGAAIAIVTMWIMVASQDYVMPDAHARMIPWLPLCLCLAYAVADETIFRGYVFRLLEYRYGSLIGLGAMGAISAVLHIAASSATGIPLSHRIAGETIAAVSTGLLLAASYMTTRRLWMPIAIQWAWSFMAGPVLGMNLTSIGINTDSWCKPWIFGGLLRSGSEFGPAASIPSAIIWIVLGGFMLRSAIRSGQWKPIGTWQPATLPVSGGDPVGAAEADALRAWLDRADKAVEQIDAWLRNHPGNPAIVRTKSAPADSASALLQAAALIARFSNGNVHVWVQIDTNQNRQFIFVRSSQTRRKMRLAPDLTGEGWRFYSDSGIPLRLPWTESAFLQLIDDLRADLPGWNRW